MSIATERIIQILRDMFSEWRSIAIYLMRNKKETFFIDYMNWAE